MAYLIWQKIWRKGISWLRTRWGLLRPCDRPQRIYLTTAEFIAEQQTISDPADSSLSADPDLVYLPLSEAYTIRRSVLPQGLSDPIPQAFLNELQHESPPTFVATMPQGRVWGIHGTVITPTNALLADVSLEHGPPPDQHPIFQQAKLPAPHRLRGRAVTLSVAGGHTYFHWMTDLLPRLDLLEQAGIDLGSIDHFILNSHALPFQSETLAALGIPKRKVVESRLYPHLVADSLIVPALPGWTGNPPQWVCHFLQQKLQPKLRRPDAHGQCQPAAKLYISRARAASRRLTNEAAVQQFLTSYGFQVVYLEALTVAEQAALFAGAQAIAAPHGAGLTNLVFCQSGTRVIELFPPNYVNVCYWALSNQVGLDYYYLVGEQVKDSTSIDLSALAQVLQMAGCDPV